MCNCNNENLGRSALELETIVVGRRRRETHDCENIRAFPELTPIQPCQPTERSQVAGPCYGWTLPSSTRKQTTGYGKAGGKGRLGPCGYSRGIFQLELGPARQGRSCERKSN